jgi:hypothetical protein
MPTHYKFNSYSCIFHKGYSPIVCLRLLVVAVAYIALAAQFRWGARYWPAVWLGALGNYWIDLVRLPKSPGATG